MEPFSPADKAGIIKGLKITSINDIDVKEKVNKDILKMITEHQNYLVIEAVLLYADKSAQKPLPDAASLTDDTAEFNVQRFLNSNVRRMTTNNIERLQGQDVFQGLTKNSSRTYHANSQEKAKGKQQQQRQASVDEIEESVYSSSLSQISVQRPNNSNYI